MPAGARTHALVADLERILSAGLLLREQLGRLVSLATQGSLGTGDKSTSLRTTLRHDLRTPLNAVKGYAELIMEDARENGREDLLGDIAKIMAAADQLLGQIDNLIGMTDTGSPDPASTPLAGVSRDLVGEIMRSIQPITSRHRPNLLSGRILVVDDTEANRELLSVGFGARAIPSLPLTVADQPWRRWPNPNLTLSCSI